MALLPFDRTCHRLSYRVIAGMVLQSVSNKNYLHHFIVLRCRKDSFCDIVVITKLVNYLIHFV